MVRELARGALHGVHAHVRADVAVYFPARQAREGLRERVGDGLKALRAAVEELDGRGGRQLAPAARELRVVYGLRRLLAAQRAGGDGLAGAHQLHQALHGVGVLVVFLRADALAELVALAVHIVRQQQPAARVGAQQQLAQQGGHLAQQRRALRQQAVLREGGEEAAALHLAHAAHGALRLRAVEGIQARGDALHVRQAHRPAAQHAGYQRVHGGRLRVQLAEQRERQRPRFEFPRAQGRQPHAGQQFFAPVVHAVPPIGLSEKRL